MTESPDERRATPDRREPEAPPPADERREGVERRQFPVLADHDDVDEREAEVRRAIDEYKQERELKRISLPKLIELLEGLGYRKPDARD